MQNPNKYRVRVTREDRNLSSGLNEVDVEFRTLEESSVQLTPILITSRSVFKVNQVLKKKTLGPTSVMSHHKKGLTAFLPSRRLHCYMQTAFVGELRFKCHKVDSHLGPKAEKRLSFMKMCDVRRNPPKSLSKKETMICAASIGPLRSLAKCPSRKEFSA